MPTTTAEPVTTLRYSGWVATSITCALERGRECYLRGVGALTPAQLDAWSGDIDAVDCLIPMEHGMNRHRYRSLYSRFGA